MGGVGEDEGVEEEEVKFLLEEVIMVIMANRALVLRLVIKAKTLVKIPIRTIVFFV